MRSRSVSGAMANSRAIAAPVWVVTASEPQRSQVSRPTRSARRSAASARSGSPTSRSASASSWALCAKNAFAT